MTHKVALNKADCSKLSIKPLTIHITMAWPDKALTPNSKRSSHWSKYRKIAAAYRAACFWDAKQALGRNRFTSLPKIFIEFHPPDLRHRDDDGMIGAFKNGRDGVADAIGFDDRLWRPTYTFHPPHRPKGQVVMALTQGGGAQ